MRTLYRVEINILAAADRKIYGLKLDGVYDRMNFHYEPIFLSCLYVRVC